MAAWSRRLRAPVDQDDARLCVQPAQPAQLGKLLAKLLVRHLLALDHLGAGGQGAGGGGAAPRSELPLSVYRCMYSGHPGRQRSAARLRGWGSLPWVFTVSRQLGSRPAGQALDASLAPGCQLSPLSQGSQ